MEKRGQVTIFIILALLIIIAIVLFFFLTGDVDSDPEQMENPKIFIDSCVQGAIEKEVQILMSNSGIKNPVKTIRYQNEEYNYLCYHGDYLRKCLNNYPILEKRVEEEIENETRVEVENCFNILESDLESRGFSVTSGSTEYSIDLAPGFIKINLEKDLTLTKEENEQNFKDFDSEINHPLHDLINVARDIVNGESSDCSFASTYYSLLNPKFIINRNYYDESRLYIITDKQSNNQIKFAVRSCVVPPGVLIE